MISFRVASTTKYNTGLTGFGLVTLVCFHGKIVYNWGMMEFSFFFTTPLTLNFLKVEVGLLISVPTGIERVVQSRSHEHCGDSEFRPAKRLVPALHDNHDTWHLIMQLHLWNPTWGTLRNTHTWHIRRKHFCKPQFVESMLSVQGATGTSDQCVADTVWKISTTLYDSSLKVDNPCNIFNKHHALGTWRFIKSQTDYLAEVTLSHLTISHLSPCWRRWNRKNKTLHQLSVFLHQGVVI